MNDDSIRSVMRDNALKILKRQKDQQNFCEHRYGSGPGGTSYRFSGNVRNSGFCYLKLPTGETIGVCLACQKLISSTNPEDEKFFTTLNKQYATVVMPESIQADIPEDEKFFAQIARLPAEEQKRITKLTLASLRTQISKEKDEKATIQHKLDKALVKGPTTADMYEMPEEELKALAEKELKKIRR